MTREELKSHSRSFVQIQFNGLDTLAGLESEDPSTAFITLSDTATEWREVLKFTLEDGDIDSMSPGNNFIFSLIKLRRDDGSNGLARA